jgi:hypothetical protein
MKPADAFQAWLSEYPRFQTVVAELAKRDRLLGVSIRTAHRSQGDLLGRVAEELLGFFQDNFSGEYTERYWRRAQYLDALQHRFNQDPSLATLGDSSALVDRDDYDISLLLSIVTATHRFEIMENLKAFLGGFQRSTGLLVSVGMGTGYELMLAHRALPDWSIEGYDIDPRSHTTARALLAHFGIPLERFSLGEEFPTLEVDASRVGRYQALILCEILEHVTDPMRWLKTCAHYLADDGRMFVTMAIRIAQEDHVFLYPDVASCRAQVADAGLVIDREFLAPASAFSVLPEKREQWLSSGNRGNYVAVLKRPG